VRRIGLVGFGSIAEHGHLPAWLSFEGVEIVAVADISGSRLDRARRIVPAATLYDSPFELIERADVDGVDICTPPGTHADLISAACRRGVADIVCEKPLVLSEEEYVQVERAKERSGSRVISVNNWAHSDLNRTVRTALAAGAVGAVREVELRIGRPDIALGNEGWNPRWRTDLRYAGGGIILDHGWHQFYLLMGWVGEPVQTVSATTRTVDGRHFPVEDEATIDMRFPAAIGHIELSWAAQGRENDGVIRGTDGSIKTYDDRIEIQSGGHSRAVRFRDRVSTSSYHPEWFASVFRDSILVKSRREADRNFAEAGAVIGAIRAAYRSASEQGTPCPPVVRAVRGDDHGHSSGGATP
jgi:predicted dehydrogenase